MLMNSTLRSLLAAATVLVLGTSPAHALYKVVGPDGKITYTDRPQAPTTGGNVTPLGTSGSGTSSAAALPVEIRQAMARFPVTLYVMRQDCNACDAGRGLLRQRGIPFNERQIITVEDGDALKRLTGALETPVLSVGSQILRGYSAELWNQYLDAAAYPRESRLPANYQFPAATPLTQRRDVSGVAPAAPASASQPEAAPTPQEAAPGGIRF
jgi:hypothetical protein